MTRQGKSHWTLSATNICLLRLLFICASFIQKCDSLHSQIFYNSESSPYLGLLLSYSIQDFNVTRKRKRKSYSAMLHKYSGLIQVVVAQYVKIVLKYLVYHNFLRVSCYFVTASNQRHPPSYKSSSCSHWNCLQEVNFSWRLFCQTSKESVSFLSQLLADDRMIRTPFLSSGLCLVSSVLFW